MLPTSSTIGTTPYTTFDSNAKINTNPSGDLIQAIKLLETAKGENALTDSFKEIVNNAIRQSSLFYP